MQNDERRRGHLKMGSGKGGVGEEGKGKRKRNVYTPDLTREEPKRTRVHAQRKFAQGAGGVSPQVSPLKDISSRRSSKFDNGSSNLVTSFSAPKGDTPKTEDFLTFLCLRGTDLLPPDLEHFNQASSASVSHNNESSDEGSSDQDDMAKDPEVDKNGVARKTAKKTAINTPALKSKTENSPTLKRKEDRRESLRKTRSHSQDSHSSPDRKTEGRQTRSQVDLSKARPEKQEIIKVSAARKNGHVVDSSDDSFSDDEIDADEEASSRESSRRPMTRKSFENKLNAKESLAGRLKLREGRSVSRDSSVSKENLKTTPSKVKPGNKQATRSEKKDSVDVDLDESKEDPSKSPKDKRDKKKKHKNKAKTSLKDLQNILLEEAKRKVAGSDATDIVETGVETSENSSKQPSCSPQDSDTGDSEERITISQKTGYISVKSRVSVDQDSVTSLTSDQVKSPVRRNSGVETVAKSVDRVPTPPRKILPKCDSDNVVTESAGPRPGHHLPVGVMGAAGLSNRSTHPVALSKSSPISSSANYSQPLMIQTTSSANISSTVSKPVVNMGSQPTIIVPAGPSGAARMPLQVSAVPLQVGMGIRPMTAGSNVTPAQGYSNVQGIPIMTPSGMQFGIPVGASPMPSNLSTMPSLPTQPAPINNGSLQIRPQPGPVVTVPTFIRSNYGYNQGQLVASVAPAVSSSSGNTVIQPQSSTLPQPQTITMPSGTTIQYNVPSSSIKQNTPTKDSSLSVMSTHSSPLVSPGPPTLSPQIPGPDLQQGTTTVTKTLSSLGGPPTLTPPVRIDDSKARRELLPGGPSPNSQPLAPQSLLNSGQSPSYHNSPPYHHSPQHAAVSPAYQQTAVSPAASYHSPPQHMSPMSSYPLSPQVQYGYQASHTTPVVYPHSSPLMSPHNQDVAPLPQEPVRPPSKPPSESASLHSPLTHSSAAASGSKKRKVSVDNRSTKDDTEGDTRSETSETPSSASSTSHKKKDKMLKSKFGHGRQPKTFDIEDNSSPYAFDFENSDSGGPNIPFRKSSSPLKPPAMIKKSLISSKNKPSESQTSHADLQPTSSKSKKSASQKSSRLKANLDQSTDQVSVDCDNTGHTGDRHADSNQEDTSSSDNETTYFIPLKNSSGQSFGVALKLGTDGPCGPNQKVIMTAKLVTDPSSKPTKAKILGAKTTETSLPARDSSSPVATTSTPAKENMTPRKMMIANSSPVSSDSKSRIRRALSPDLTQPSCSKDTSVSSGGGKRRPNCLIGNVSTGHRFPRLGQHAQMMEAPTFRPTEAEFKDPLKYIQKIRGYAEQFGMCRIIPPGSFKPECNVDDDMRFTAYNQYINRMMSRSGQNSKETAAIKKYLETQNCDTRNHPLVGGLEVDLPALFHAVQSFGGLSEVIQKKKWNKIADYMRVARGANVNSAANKLDDVYVKWLLPYDTLSNVEREELIRLVEEEWAEKAERSRVKEEIGSEDEDDEEEEDEDQEAVIKGKSTSLTQFYRVAKNLMSSIFRGEEPPHHIVEDEYWKIVADKDVHMQVCQGSIDTGNQGYGFPIRNSKFSSHPWNLKQLTSNPRSVLRAMGRVMGVTQPTLHVGMLFTTGCWYRDPHGLPWVEFLHTGAPKIWYGIPDDHSLAFYTAMKQLVPGFCKNRKIWLPSDTTMVSPSYLVKHGVSVCRAVQQPGQFVVVFPRSYTSNICTGYNVSESVYFAHGDWLNDVDAMFQVLI